MMRFGKAFYIVSAAISIFARRCSADEADYATATESCEELSPANTWQDVMSIDDCVFAHLALNGGYPNGANDGSGSSAEYYNAPCGCTYHKGFGQINWWGIEGSGCSATNKCMDFRFSPDDDDNDAYCFCKRKAAPTISPAPTPSIPETAAPNNYDYDCDDRNTCCYFPCNQLKLGGDQRHFDQITNCGPYCEEGIVPDLNGVIHPDLWLGENYYYTKFSDYSYDDYGPMTIDGSNKNMYERCFSQCHPGETLRPTVAPNTARPTPSPNNDPACLTKCGTSTKCSADNISRFLFAGQSNMEGNPEEANPGLYYDLLRILNTKGKNKKWKLEEMEKEIMDQEYCEEESVSENEARFMFKLRRFTRKKGKSAITRENKKVVCSFTDPEMIWLDCERPMTSTACGRPFGPELMFAQQFPKLKSPLKKKKVGIIKVAQGGTEIYKHWMKDSGIYWPKLRDAITAAKGSIEAFVWFQGENDSFDDWNQNNYLDHLTEFVADVRNEIFVTSEKFQSAEDVPVVIVELGAWRRGTIVIEAQRTFVKNTKNTKLVKTGADEDERQRMTGNYHFDSASMLIIGSRVAKAVAKLLKG